MIPYKNMKTLIGGCTTGYIGILRNILRIILSGEMVSLEKHPVFLNCYRLALGHLAVKRSYNLWYDSFQCSSVWKGTENHQIEGVPNGRLGVGSEHCQIVSQLSNQNFQARSWNVGTMRGRSNEVVEVMCRRKADICGLQEVK